MLFAVDAPESQLSQASIVRADGGVLEARQKDSDSTNDSHAKERTTILLMEKHIQFSKIYE